MGKNWLKIINSSCSNVEMNAGEHREVNMGAHKHSYLKQRYWLEKVNLHENITGELTQVNTGANCYKQTQLNPGVGVYK